MKSTKHTAFNEECTIGGKLLTFISWISFLLWSILKLKKTSFDFGSSGLLFCKFGATINRINGTFPIRTNKLYTSEKNTFKKDKMIECMEFWWGMSSFTNNIMNYLSAYEVLIPINSFVSYYSHWVSPWLTRYCRCKII